MCKVPWATWLTNMARTVESENPQAINLGLDRLQDSPCFTIATHTLGYDLFTNEFPHLPGCTE